MFVSINCETCFSLDDLQGEEKLLQRILVEQMINSDPMERPPASAVRKHPIFWNKTQILTFFQVQNSNYLVIYGLNMFELLNDVRILINLTTAR